MPKAKILTSDALSADRVRTLRAWLDDAFDGEFEPADWAHALGGVHALICDESGIVSHGAVVPRRIECGGRMLRVGYVEAVATRAEQRKRGHATAVMTRLGEVIQRTYDLGLLSTGLHEVYAPLGWRRWEGASYVHTAQGRERTAEDDDSLMALRTPRTPDLDLRADIVADWRDGDVW